MIYIFETELLPTKPIVFALQKIYGLGLTKSLKICKRLGYSQNFKLSLFKHLHYVHNNTLLFFHHTDYFSFIKFLQALMIKLLISRLQTFFYFTCNR